MEKREFAFLLFREKTMLRHKGFKTAGDFRAFLQSVAPSDVYYSSAYFEKPEAEMDAKGWLGADLIFDIDADHIPTHCNKQHDTWICKNCGNSGRGTKPEQCSKCQGQKFTDVSWPCDACLESAKEETMKLIDAMEEDFGISTKEITLAFSGHRGYHVHIENETIRTLDSIARREIVDYLLGLGLEPILQGLDKDTGPNLEDSGWRGRIAKGTYEFLLTTSQEQLEKASIKKKAASSIIQQRDRITESWKQSGPWKILKGIGPDTWKRIIQQAIEKRSVKIDTVVTTDVHRLIRLTNTLHGETGLLKTEVPIDMVERFDPFKNAIAFKRGTLRVDVSDAPKFRLADDVYGPFNNESLELPAAPAVLLLCKGAAKVTEEKQRV